MEAKISELEIQLEEEKKLNKETMSSINDEKLRHDSEQKQLAEIKDHLEEVLTEAKAKLKESEEKLTEEKDRFEQVCNILH